MPSSPESPQAISLPDLGAVAQPMALDELGPGTGRTTGVAADAGIAALDELASRRAPRRAAPHLFEVASQRGSTDAASAPDRTAAQAAGYAAGWANGMRAAKAVMAAEAATTRAATQQALQDIARRRATAFAALDAAAARLERSVAPNADQLTDQVLSTAYAIAEALVGHDLRTDPARAPHVLAHVLALVPDHEEVTVRLSPADHATLTADGAVAQTDRSVRLVADASLQPGDAIAVSGAMNIDGRIAAGLARVRACLNLDAPAGPVGGAA